MIDFFLYSFTIITFILKLLLNLRGLCVPKRKKMREKLGKDVYAVSLIN
jgi:hypothetical protein